MQFNHYRGEFVKQIFSRPKKYGDIRIILNLSQLNLNVEYVYFMMETFHTVFSFIEKDS